MDNWITIGSEALSAAINPLGAELSSLKDAAGRELMTDADPAFWRGRAPILFPIVGRLNDDVLWVEGDSYRMEKHGFARRSMFDLADASASHAILRMTDTAETRDQYPFGFLLEIGFAIDGATLTMTAKVGNPGDDPLPASFGWHPAFAWPLPYGVAREEHRMVFAGAEPDPVRGLNSEGLIAEDRATPVVGNTLMLADALFEGDALIWNPVRSRALRYGGTRGPQLDFAWDAPRLG
ncbi:MAG: aldose epimerase, partial [Sphingomonas sp.]|nr:aldose epimerase [Sphingomonas sp.]